MAGPTALKAPGAPVSGLLPAGQRGGGRADPGLALARCFVLLWPGAGSCDSQGRSAQTGSLRGAPKMSVQEGGGTRTEAALGLRSAMQFQPLSGRLSGTPGCRVVCPPPTRGLGVGAWGAKLLLRSLLLWRWQLGPRTPGLAGTLPAEGSPAASTNVPRGLQAHLPLQRLDRLEVYQLGRRLKAPS